MEAMSGFSSALDIGFSMAGIFICRTVVAGAVVDRLWFRDLIDVFEDESIKHDSIL